MRKLLDSVWSAYLSLFMLVGIFHLGTHPNEMVGFNPAGPILVAITMGGYTVEGYLLHWLYRKPDTLLLDTPYNLSRFSFWWLMLVVVLFVASEWVATLKLESVGLSLDYAGAVLWFTYLCVPVAWMWDNPWAHVRTVKQTYGPVDTNTNYYVRVQFEVGLMLLSIAPVRGLWPLLLLLAAVLARQIPTLTPSQMQ